MISVIVPVYNTEKFLNRCVDSILNQTYGDLEILLVDDGSTDKSPAICEEYAAVDPRVKVVHRENGGLSAARNTGIENATGEYFLFLDSDDEMLPTMAEELLFALEKTDADIAICAFYQIIEGEPRPNIEVAETFDENLVGQIRVYEGREKMEQFLANNLVTVVQWNKLFRRKIFDDIRYPEGKLHEDEFVIHRELDVAGKVAYIDRKLHLYYRHGESISWNPSAEKVSNVLEAYEGRMDFLEKNGYQDLIGKTYILYKAFMANFKDEKKNYGDLEAWDEDIKGRSRWIEETYSRYYENLSLGEKAAAQTQLTKNILYFKKESLKKNRTKKQKD